MVSGVAVPGINRNAIYKRKMFVPPFSINNHLDSIAQPAYQEIALLQKKNKILSTTRDILLHKLISGEIDVEHLDIKTEDTE
jgi:type I restriction enzyme S subunit